MHRDSDGFLVSEGVALYVMRADGMHRRKLLDQLDGALDWAPDGRSIVCSANGAILRVAIAARSRPRVIASGGARSIAWSPDGRQIAYVEHFDASEEQPSERLVVIAADGGRRHVLRRFIGDIDNGAPEGSVAWQALPQ